MSSPVFTSSHAPSLAHVHSGTRAVNTEVNVKNAAGNHADELRANCVSCALFACPMRSSNNSSIVFAPWLSWSSSSRFGPVTAWSSTSVNPPPPPPPPPSVVVVVVVVVASCRLMRGRRAQRVFLRYVLLLVLELSSRTSASVSVAVARVRLNHRVP